MSWARVDDQFADHPKVMAAGPLASWLYVCGLAYCARLLTDGFIPSGQVRKLADVENAGALADRLVTVGLWERHTGGYRVHDFHDHNPTRDEVLRLRDRHSTAYSEWRRAVLARDKSRCVACGATAPLHAHHIKPWASFPEQRFDVGNGVMLCAPCHQALHQEARR